MHEYLMRLISAEPAKVTVVLFFYRNNKLEKRPTVRDVLFVFLRRESIYRSKKCS